MCGGRSCCFCAGIIIDPVRSGMYLSVVRVSISLQR